MDKFMTIQLKAHSNMYKQSCKCLSNSLVNCGGTYDEMCFFFQIEETFKPVRPNCNFQMCCSKCHQTS